MDFLHYRILFLPLLFAAGLFITDKIFFLKPVRDRVLLYKKVEPDLYDSRRELLQQLLSDLPGHEQSGRRVGIILGSSRSAEFDTKEIERILPGTATYNFSVPMGGIAHAFYYAEQLHRSGVRPAFLMVETDFINFASPSLSFALQYDFDPAFMLRHTNFLDPDNALNGGFRPDETDTFFMKYLFALNRYPFHPANVIENYKPAAGIDPALKLKNMEFRWHHQRMVTLSNREHLGAIPNPLQIHAGDEMLEKDAGLVRGRVLGDGKISPTQRLLFDRLLQLAIAEKIPVLFYRPVVSSPFQRILKQTSADFEEQVLLRRIKEMEDNAPDPKPILLYSDPEKTSPLQCRAFVDAVHLSGRCYAELTERTFWPLRSVINP